MGKGAFQLIEINPKFLDELARHASGFPERWFVQSVSAYVASRNDPEATHAEVRDDLDKIAELAGDLASRLAARSKRLGAYLGERELRHGLSGFVDRVLGDLRSLSGIAEMARRDAELLAKAGRTSAARTELVANLAGGLMQADLPVTAKPQDRLVIAFGIALAVVGEEVAAPAKTVKSALETIRKKRAG